MRLTKLAVTNFRSIEGQIEIAVPSRHIVLVGSNNAGKSNIVTALDWVLGSRTPYNLRATPDDYYMPGKSIVIEATLGDITADDKRHLMGVATNQKQRGALASKESPEIILTLTIPATDPGAASDDDGADDEAEAGTPRPTLLVNLWGFTVHRKTTDLRRVLAQVVKVNAQRTVQDDLQASQWTPYGQLMKAVLEAAPQYEALIDLLRQVNSKLQEVFADQKDTMIADARVVSYVEDIAFQLTRENNPAEFLRYLEILVTEGGRQTNVSRMGTGTQSAVIIAMLELVLRARTSYVKVFAVEEPDAFVQPHGVRRLASLIRRIGGDDKAQVVLTTHSPSLLATLAPRDIVRIEKRGAATKVFQAPTRLADPAFARYVTRDTAEMFFARRVLLVEGATERFLLPPLSTLVQSSGQVLDFDRERVSVVELNGKGSVLSFLKILDSFEIETRAILDKDFLGDSTCRSLVSYFNQTDRPVDDSTDAKLRSDLRKYGVIVLREGEIEDYIPEADVATVSGRSPAEVQTEFAAADKRSAAFRKLFGTTKPLYARQLAEYYVEHNTVPEKLAPLIAHVVKR
ncbi:MAG: AAA family ATPase [Solirubrobacteraceae bacterium]